MLRKRDMTAGEIADQFQLAKSTLSGHFRVLKHAQLIVSEKNRTSVVYSLNTSVLEQTLAAVFDLLAINEETERGAKNPTDTEGM